MKKRVVITGGAGFIGSNLANFFSQNYEESEVLVVDIFRNNEKFSNGNLKSFGHYKNLANFKGEILCGDINCEKTMQTIAKFNPEIIFHQAAISDTTAKEQDEIMKTNLNSFYPLLEIAKEKGAKLIYASSGATYGNLPSPQQVGKEAPANVYGYSKLKMDDLAMKYHKKYNLHIVGLRYFNVYGKGEFYKDKTSSMILQFGLQILKNGSAKLFSGSDKIYRDFVYVKDIVSANLAAINGKSGIYNAATGVARSFYDITQILQKELKIDAKIEYIDNPFISQYQFHTQADIESTKENLGYEPKFSLEEGIKDYLPEILRIYKEELNG